MKFNISNLSDQDLEVVLIDQSEGYFELELPKKVEAGKSAQGTLRLLEDAIETSFEKSFTIGLSDEKSTRFTIPVKRSIQIPGGKKPTANLKKDEEAGGHP